MKEIPLTRGYVALVDDEDYPELSRHKWHIVGQKRRLYAARKHRVDGVKTSLFMHVAIMQPPDGYQVDHVDGNALNNQRSNLRIATAQENARNKRNLKKESHTSRYKGVSWDKNLRKWRAWIRHENKMVYLGVHEYEKGAALAYDEAAKQYHGEFASLNFPEDTAAEVDRQEEG